MCMFRGAMIKATSDTGSYLAVEHLVSKALHICTSLQAIVGKDAAELEARLAV